MDAKRALFVERHGISSYLREASSPSVCRRSGERGYDIRTQAVKTERFARGWAESEGASSDSPQHGPSCAGKPSRCQSRAGKGYAPSPMATKAAVLVWGVLT